MSSSRLAPSRVPALLASTLALLASPLAGCGGGPSCQEAAERASRALGQSDASKTAKLVEVCAREGWSGELRRCIAELKTPADLVVCAKLAPPGSEFGAKRKGAPPTSEAIAGLAQIERGVKRAFATSAKLPAEAAPLTPATACCAQNHGGDRACAPAPADWGTPAWRAVEFSLAAPHRFQFSYTPSADGTSYVATAVGDLDCDGTTITYELRGEIVDGAHTAKISEPPPNSD